MTTFKAAVAAASHYDNVFHFRCRPTLLPGYAGEDSERATHLEVSIAPGASRQLDSLATLCEVARVPIKLAEEMMADDQSALLCALLGARIKGEISFLCAGDTVLLAHDKPVPAFGQVLAAAEAAAIKAGYSLAMWEAIPSQLTLELMSGQAVQEVGGIPVHQFVLLEVSRALGGAGFSILHGIGFSRPAGLPGAPFVTSYTEVVNSRNLKPLRAARRALAALETGLRDGTAIDSLLYEAIDSSLRFPTRHLQAQIAKAVAEVIDVSDPNVLSVLTGLGLPADRVTAVLTANPNRLGLLALLPTTDMADDLFWSSTSRSARMLSDLKKQKAEAAIPVAAAAMEA